MHLERPFPRVRLRAFLVPTFATLLLLPAGACRPTADERPNIIVLLINTLRADHLGSYGFAGAISPNLDRLARESILFENCFAQAPWTPPSIGTLFTSLYPQVHGLHSFEQRAFRDPKSGELRASVLPDEAITLAESLRDAGFSTAGFVANPWLEHTYGLGQGFEVYDDREVSKRTPATALTAAARDWLADHPRSEPFFLYMHFMDVHEPYDSPRGDFEVLRPAIEASHKRVLGRSNLPPDYMEITAPWAGEKMRRQLWYWRTRYAAGVRLLDRRIREFLESLREAGLLDRSYLVVTSDHGEELFEHFGWGHGKNLYDHQLRVPLLVRPPGGVTGGRTVESHIRLIDLMPTILSVAGADPPPGMQGVDASPLLREESFDLPLPLFATGVVGRPDQFSLRTDRYKLLLHRKSNRWRLYDLDADPTEIINVEERKPEVAAVMLDVLTSHLESATSSGTLSRETAEVPQEMQERLKALGYLN